jgi:hypothetical protein
MTSILKINVLREVKIKIRKVVEGVSSADKRVNEIYLKSQTC